MERTQRVLGTYKERFRKEFQDELESWVELWTVVLVEFLSYSQCFPIQFKTLTFGCKYARWPLGSGL